MISPFIVRAIIVYHTKYRNGMKYQIQRNIRFRKDVMEMLSTKSVKADMERYDLIRDKEQINGQPLSKLMLKLLQTLL